jgi:hypothetical protein
MSNPLNALVCAGEKINPLKGFESGCLFTRVLDGQTLVLSGINIGASTITVERVIEGNCDEKYYLPMQAPGGCSLLVTGATPMQAIKVAGYYRLCISPANPDALLGQEYIASDSAACCSINAQCQPVVVAPPLAPATAAVTGLPCPLPASFVWNSATTTLSAFIADVKAQVAGAVYNAGTCTFTAPEGSVFPPLVVSAVVVVPPAPPNTSVITPCPTGYPILFLGVRHDNLIALKKAIEEYYGVGACYDEATCTLTKVSGACTLPPTVAIENNCGFYLGGGLLITNGGNAQCRKVLAPSALLPLAGFTEFNDNANQLVTLLRLTVGTQCGITFNAPVNDNSGNLVGYGAQL